MVPADYVSINNMIDKGYDHNSSGLIRDDLPRHISRTPKRPIEILKYPHGTICSYESEKALWPALWSGRRDVYDSSASPDESVEIDLMIHMGMRGKATRAFSLEKQARRDVYTRPGDDGKYLPAGDADKGGIWEGVPKVLRSGFDVDAAKARVAAVLPDVELEVSENAGVYFCEHRFEASRPVLRASPGPLRVEHYANSVIGEFELFSSLAECFKRNEFARVEFLHTPQGNSPEAIARGVRVAEELICALLDQRLLPEKVQGT
ncbi:hypothetical protein EG329_008176 [Mollisiaceae sp. DMI_Dod_QoI]|nr:hypothetical protein EG329_008176 [Helotiales sp. DMI_Dod_QoI]